MKVLKIWNGRPQGHKHERYHVYVAAYSVKQAAELIGIACDLGRSLSEREINVYYAKGCWGNKMNGIEPKEPCVYLCDERVNTNKPFRVI